MKKLKLITLFIMIVNFSFAQNYLGITYLKVPRQNISEFLSLHKEMSEISQGENRLIKGHFVYSHRHASNYSLVIVNTFDTPADIGKDQTISQPYVVALMTQSLELKKNHKYHQKFSW